MDIGIVIQISFSEEYDDCKGIVVPISFSYP